MLEVSLKIQWVDFRLFGIISLQFLVLQSICWFLLWQQANG
jgi:intracellular septation protein A